MKSKIQKIIVLLLVLLIIAGGLMWFDKSRGFPWYFKLKGFPFADLLQFKPSPDGLTVAYLTKEGAGTTGGGIHHFVYITRGPVDFPEKLVNYSLTADLVEMLKAESKTADTTSIAWSKKGRYLVLLRAGFDVWVYDLFEKKQLPAGARPPLKLEGFIALEKEIQDLVFSDE